MGDNITEADSIKSLFELYQNSEKRLRYIAKDILATSDLSDNNAGVNQLLGSIIHMNLNRLFLSEPRMHEMILYDFLCTYYRSRLKRG